MQNPKLIERTLVTAIGSVALYWFFESVAMAYLFREDTLVRELFNPNWHELWMRLMAMALLAVLVVVLQYEAHSRMKVVNEREQALAQVKTLSGLVPICAWCKKIRDDAGYWQGVEKYIEGHSQAEFTHGICPECSEKVGP